MDLSRLRAWAQGHRTLLTLASAFLLFIGVELILFTPKGTDLEWFGLPFLAAGGFLLAYLYLPRREEAPAPAGPPKLATKLLHRLTWGGRLMPWLPGVGILLIALDVGFNAFLAATPGLGTQDILLLMLGAFLIAFRLVPERYAVGRDTVFVFLLVLNLILNVPILLFRAANADFNASVDAYAWALLAPQTSASLNLFGVGSWVGSCPEIARALGQNFQCTGIGSPGIVFTPLHGAEPVALFITTACSGIYSFGLFTSIFTAYVTTEYTKLTRRVVLFLVLGAVASYVANILRMTVIGLVGYYGSNPQESIQNMLLAHSNAGLLIFLGWVSLFMAVMFKFLKPPVEEIDTTTAKPATVEERPRGTRCALCGDAMTLAIKGTRCTCGRFYHEPCLANAGACPECRTPYARPAETATA